MFARAGSSLSVAFVLAATLSLSSRAASAQTQPASAPVAAQIAPRERRNALVFNPGASLGILGGAYPRAHLELQLHRGPRFQGHALGLGLAGVYRPDLGAVRYMGNRSWFEPAGSVAFTARYQFDHPLVEGTRFFVSPYAGLEAGVAIVANRAELGGVRIAVTPVAGLELKVVFDRLVLGLRPLGVTVPLLFGERDERSLRVQWDIWWDMAATIGMTL